jgi:hypothetical protein
MNFTRQPSSRLPKSRPRWAYILLLHSLLTIPVSFLSGCSNMGGRTTALSPSQPPSPPTISAPAITTNPASTTVTVGQSATFSVVATGTVPLSYQWQKNGVIISGATSSTYTTPPTQTSDDGSIFTVVVSNSAGGLVSSPAMLSVAAGAARLAADSSNISFGNVVVGSSSTAVVTLSNSGTAPARISSVTVPAQGFSTPSALAGVTIAAGQTATLSIVFTPTSAAAFSGTITIASDAANSPTISIPVSGTGVAPASHSVTLSWVPSTSSDVVGYQILRGTQSGGPYTQLNAASITAITYTDTTVQAGQTYFYVIVAVDAAGQTSTPSNEASVTIPSP